MSLFILDYVLLLRRISWEDLLNIYCTVDICFFCMVVVPMYVFFLRTWLNDQQLVTQVCHATLFNPLHNKIEN